MKVSCYECIIIFSDGWNEILRSFSYPPSGPGGGNEKNIGNPVSDSSSSSLARDRQRFESRDSLPSYRFHF